jgi:hypothetical protein
LGDRDENRSNRNDYFNVLLGYLYSEVSKLKLNYLALVRERIMSIERPPVVGEVVPTFADRGCCVVSATDSHGR